MANMLYDMGHCFDELSGHAAHDGNDNPFCCLVAENVAFRLAMYFRNALLGFTQDQLSIRGRTSKRKPTGIER